MSNEAIKRILEFKHPRDLEIGTVLEVSSITTKTDTKTEYGPMHIASYKTVIKGVKSSGNLLIPARVMTDEAVRSPCILVWLGEKQGKKNDYLNMKKYKPAVAFRRVSDMEKPAEHLRSLGLEMLEQHFSVRSLAGFKTNTVLCLEGWRKRGKEHLHKQRRRSVRCDV